MNKRHYEHTLPNIRGSLSNTYDQARQPTFASEKSDGDGREETVEVIHIIDIKGRGLRPSIRAEEKREV